jgi:TonB family protein
MRRAGTIAAGLAVALAAALACHSTPAAAPRAALPPACTTPPAPESLGAHDLYLAASLVRRNAPVRADAPVREVLDRLLADLRGRIDAPAELAVAFDPMSAFVGGPDTATVEPQLPEFPRPSSDKALGARFDSVRKAGLVTAPVVHSQLRFTVHDDGRVTRLARSRRSPLVGLDSAIRAAVQESGSSGALRGLVSRAGIRADSVELAIDLLTEPVRVDSAGALVSIGRVRLPHYRLLPPMPRGVWGSGPAYPDAARAARREGRVVMKLVVLPTGTVDLASAEVLHGAPEFASAILEALPRMRFRPAVVGACAVAQELVQPFDFEIVR